MFVSPDSWVALRLVDDLARRCRCARGSRRCPRSRRAEAELLQPVGGQDHGALVAVGDRDEHRARRAACRRTRPPGSSRTRVGKSRSMPMTSPVERISGPSTESTVWPSLVRNRLKGSTASLTATGASSGTREPSIAGQQPLGLELGDRRAGHDARGGLRERDAERLRDERHRAARPRVRLDHVEHARADGELDVEEAADADALGDRERRDAHAVDLGAAEARSAAACSSSRRSGCRPPRGAP